MAKNNKEENRANQTKAYISEMNEMAEELYKIRQDLLTREERFEKETDDLYMKEAHYKGQLLEKLKTVGMKSIKVSNGDSWFISQRPAIEVINEAEFNRWAIKNQLVKPNTDLIKKHLQELVKNNKDLPLCVEFTKNDSISIRKQKED